ncbi:MAG: sigma factor [bacterium]|nr:sigma factor [bacterium]
MFSNIGDEVREAIKTEEGRTAFIRKHENYIISCASKFCKHYITKSDDEWSIALIAFSNAMDTYNDTKGSFLSYARLLIEHRLTDYFRSQARYQNEIHTEPFVFEGNADDEGENAAFQMHIAKAASTTDENPIADEIIALNQLLGDYGITFMELTTCSPKAAKTKAACISVITYMKEHPLLVTNLRSSKQLPTKILIENTDVPRKILERHRKYIITAVEIVCGDFPLLAEYIKL